MLYFVVGLLLFMGGRFSVGHFGLEIHVFLCQEMFLHYLLGIFISLFFLFSLELLFRSQIAPLIFFSFCLLSPTFISLSLKLSTFYFLGSFVSFLPNWIFYLANMFLISKNSVLLSDCHFGSFLFLFLGTISFIFLSILEKFSCNAWVAQSVKPPPTLGLG